MNNDLDVVNAKLADIFRMKTQLGQMPGAIQGDAVQGLLQAAEKMNGNMLGIQPHKIGGYK